MWEPTQKRRSRLVETAASTAARRSQVTALRETHHIYILMDGRLCMAALTKESCKVLATAIKDVLLREQEEAGASTAPTAKRLRRA